MGLYRKGVLLAVHDDRHGTVLLQPLQYGPEAGEHVRKLLYEDALFYLFIKELMGEAAPFSQIYHTVIDESQDYSLLTMTATERYFSSRSSMGPRQENMSLHITYCGFLTVRAK